MVKIVPRVSLLLKVALTCLFGSGFYKKQMTLTGLEALWLK